ncbi:peptidase [Desulfoscipio sp. XC116]|uniref:peptidase n=1 Tax=Desulfoscipio sp. XC116 TaxID=3144975 RepID=UPI00325AE5AD
MSDKEHAISALTQMIRSNNEKAEKNLELRDWFNNLNRDLMQAVESLRKSA